MAGRIIFARIAEYFIARQIIMGQYTTISDVYQLMMHHIGIYLLTCNWSAARVCLACGKFQTTRTSRPWRMQARGAGKCFFGSMDVHIILPIAHYCYDCMSLHLYARIRCIRLLQYM